MVCDEKKQACLNYAANVPEWVLTDQLKAIQALSGCACQLTDIVQALTGGLVYDRYEHPYAGDNDRPDYSQKLGAAGYLIGDAVCALEVLAAQSPFSYAKTLVENAEAAYSTQHALLEERCRKHGMEEVAYHHG